MCCYLQRGNFWLVKIVTNHYKYQLRFNLILLKSHESIKHGGRKKVMMNDKEF